jgi:hypothetical protein
MLSRARSIPGTACKNLGTACKNLPNHPIQFATLEIGDK